MLTTTHSSLSLQYRIIGLFFCLRITFFIQIGPVNPRETVFFIAPHHPKFILYLAVEIRRNRFNHAEET